MQDSLIFPGWVHVLICTVTLYMYCEENVQSNTFYFFQSNHKGHERERHTHGGRKCTGWICLRMFILVERLQRKTLECMCKIVIRKRAWREIKERDKKVYKVCAFAFERASEQETEREGTWTSKRVGVLQYKPMCHCLPFQTNCFHLENSWNPFVFTCY